MPRAFLRKKHPFLYVLKLFVLFSLYVVTGFFCLKLHPVSHFATFVWLPSGISLAALILCGVELWPAIFLGAFVLNCIIGAFPLVALGIATGNSLEAFIVYFLLSTGGFDYALGRLKDIMLFIFLAVPLGSILAALIGTTSLFLGGIVNADTFSSTWQAWFVGDLISMVIVTPFLITWFSDQPYHFLIWPRGAEALLLLLTTTIVGFGVFHGTIDGIFANTPRTYLVFPVIIWASLRFGSRAVATNIAILSLAGITGILMHVGPFATTPFFQGFFSLQIFTGILSATGLILASLDTERKAYVARKDEFIGLVSHELKTPLTGLKVFTQMLEKSLHAKKKTKEMGYLEKMGSEITRLNSLISDLLDITQIRSGTFAFSKEYITLFPFLKTTIETIQPTTNHSIILNYIKKNQDIRIYADKERLQQVCINLLANAIKYSPAHKKIIITVNSQKRFIMISVKDFGIGISPKDAKRIFERYYRATSESNLTYPGLGLGLYVSYEIVKEHGGNMWVESAKGKGSTFYVRLPIEKQPTSFWQRGFFLKKSE